LNKKILKYYISKCSFSNFRTTLVLFLLLYFSGSLIANSNLTYYTLTIDDGLPSETVWTSLQDTLGYVWLGTANGLCRYDGKNIEVFKTKNGLTGNSVTSLTLDLDNNIVAGCYQKGINIIKYDKDGNIKIETPKLTGSLNWDVYVEDSICIYYHPKIIMKKNLFSNEEKRLRVKYSHPRIRKIAEDKFLVLAGNKLHEINKNLDILNTAILDSVYINLKIYGDTIYLLNKHKLIKKHKNNLQSTEVLVNNLNLKGDVSSFYLFDDYIYFNVVNKGFHYLNLKSSRNDVLFLGNQFGIDSLDVCYFNETNCGTSIISTMGKGCIFGVQQNIRNFTYSKDLPFRSVSSYIYDKHSNSYYIINSKNLFVIKNKKIDKFYKKDFDFLSKNFTVIQSNSVGKIVITYPDYKEPVFFNGTSLYFTKKNTYTFKGVDSLTFFTKYLKEGKIKYKTINIDKAPQQLNDEYLNVIEYTQKSFTKDGFKVVHYFDDKYLLYNPNGIILLDVSKKSIESNLSKTLDKTRIHDVKVDSFKNIWVATEDGLIAFKDSVWQEFKSVDFVTNNSFRKITIDKNNNLWFATMNGIVYYNKRNFYHFKKSVGFLSNQLENIACNTIDNELLVSSEKGLSFIPIDELLRSINKKPNIPFRIQKVYSDFNSFKIKDNIELKPFEDEIYLDVDLLHYNNPKELFIQYKLNDLS